MANETMGQRFLCSCGRVYAITNCLPQSITRCQPRPAGSRMATVISLVTSGRVNFDPVFLVSCFPTELLSRALICFWYVTELRSTFAYHRYEYFIKHLSLLEPDTAAPLCAPSSYFKNQWRLGSTSVESAKVIQDIHYTPTYISIYSLFLTYNMVSFFIFTSLTSSSFIYNPKFELHCISTWYALPFVTFMAYLILSTKKNQLIWSWNLVITHINCSSRGEIAIKTCCPLIKMQIKF